MSYYPTNRMRRWTEATQHGASKALTQIEGLLKLRAEIIKLATADDFLPGQDELTGPEDDFLMLVDSYCATTKFYLRNCDGGYTIRIEACRPYLDHDEDEGLIDLLKTYELDQSDSRFGSSGWLKDLPSSASLRPKT